MLSILRTLYNNGQNNGDVILKTKEQEIKCHSFVLETTSDYFKSCIKYENFNGVIEMDLSFEITNIIINFLYSEKIIDKDLTAGEIIRLFTAISSLQCSDSIIILKNYYAKKFPKLLNEDNWHVLLEQIFNTNKYAGLQEMIMEYYENNILNNIDLETMFSLKDTFAFMNGEIKNVLFAISLKKINALLEEIRDNSSETKIALNQCINDIDEVEDYVEEYEEPIKKSFKKPIKRNTKA